MIDIDIAVVTYNSQKWIDSFLTSFANSQEVDLSKIHFYFADNCSIDNTTEALKKHICANSFGTFEVIECEKNLGFGAGSNKAASLGTSPYIFFVNIDTEIERDALKKLSDIIENAVDTTAVWELRQMPYEHPKIYNPVTMETSWVSGACFVLRRDVFEKTGGFDEDIFMYGEDVELSWRVRSLGYKLLYLPECCINHYSYSSANQVKPLQYFGSLKANILLRWRYGNLKDIITGYINLARYVIKPNHFPKARLKVMTIILESLAKGFLFRKKFKKVSTDIAKFIGFEYEYARRGAFYENKRYDSSNTPLVSIIVRTCQRPFVLRECLETIRNQTYKNIEICIAEDGDNYSESYIRENFPELNIRYASTGEKKGRSFAGNLALSMATGEYLNFLDDDDVFYADHIETMVNEALKQPHQKMFYAKCFETPIIIKSKEPYLYKLTDYIDIERPNYSQNTLSICNLFPIQTVFFKRSVYEQLGGFDTSYEYLEDWELWLKFSTLYDYIPVNKTTSEYRVPAESQSAKKRTELLKINEAEIRSKYMHLNKCVRLDYSLVSFNPQFTYSIDSVNIFTDNIVYISGWGFSDIHTLENEKIYICVTDRKRNKHFFETEKYLRCDVAKAYPDTTGKKCGISSIIVFEEYISKIELVCINNGTYYINRKHEYIFFKTRVIEKLRKLSKYKIYEILFSIAKMILKKLKFLK